MQTTRTTVRLEEPLRRQARAKALEMNVTFQKLLSQALEAYLRTQSQDRAKKMIFHSQKVGAPLDNLTREDMYAD